MSQVVDRVAVRQPDVVAEHKTQVGLHRQTDGDARLLAGAVVVANGRRDVAATLLRRRRYTSQIDRAAGVHVTASGQTDHRLTAADRLPTTAAASTAGESPPTADGDGQRHRQYGGGQQGQPGDQRVVGASETAGTTAGLRHRTRHVFQ